MQRSLIAFSRPGDGRLLRDGGLGAGSDEEAKELVSWGDGGVGVC